MRIDWKLNGEKNLKIEERGKQQLSKKMLKFQMEREERERDMEKEKGEGDRGRSECKEGGEEKCETMRERRTNFGFSGR